MKKLLILFLFPFILIAQEFPNSIKVIARSEVYVNADVITFTIRIKQKHIEPKFAFEEHKRSVRKLLNLLTSFNISDSSVSYSLFDIQNGRALEKEPLFITNQDVYLKLENNNDYTNLHIALLENGFYGITVSFSPGNLTGVKEKGYRKALLLATEDAQAIAKAMNKNVGEIIDVETSTRDYPHFDSRQVSGVYETGNGPRAVVNHSMIVATTVTIRFEIVDD